MRKIWTGVVVVLVLEVDNVAVVVLATGVHNIRSPGWKGDQVVFKVTNSTFVILWSRHSSFFSSHPVVLFLFISRFALVRSQIDSILAGSKKFFGRAGIV